MGWDEGIFKAHNIYYRHNTSYAFYSEQKINLCSDHMFDTMPKHNFFLLCFLVICIYPSYTYYTNWSNGQCIHTRIMHRMKWLSMLCISLLHASSILREKAHAHALLWLVYFLLSSWMKSMLENVFYEYRCFLRREMDVMGVKGKSNLLGAKAWKHWRISHPGIFILRRK